MFIEMKDKTFISTVKVNVEVILQKRIEKRNSLIFFVSELFENDERLISLLSPI